MSDLICYCFDYSHADIVQDYERHGESRILERIISEKQLGNCQCAVKNPKGK